MCDVGVFLNILYLGLLLPQIITAFISEEWRDKWLYFFIPLVLVFLIYFVFVFCYSTTAQAIEHFYKISDFKEHLAKIVEAPPRIVLSCECYHHGHKNQVIVSHKIFKELLYYSWKDISDKIVVDEGKDEKSKNSILILTFDFQFEMNDDGSIQDAELQKEEFQVQCKTYDDHIECKDIQTLDGFDPEQDTYGISLNDEESPWYLSSIILFFVALLPIYIFYVVMVYCNTIENTQTIKKLISIRNDLTKPEFQSKRPITQVVINNASTPYPSAFGLAPLPLKEITSILTMGAYEKSDKSHIFFPPSPKAENIQYPIQVLVQPSANQAQTISHIFYFMDKKVLRFYCYEESSNPYQF